MLFRTNTGFPAQSDIFDAEAMVKTEPRAQNTPGTIYIERMELYSIDPKLILARVGSDCPSIRIIQYLYSF